MKKHYKNPRAREVNLDPVENVLLNNLSSDLDDTNYGGDAPDEDEAGTKYTNSIWCWPTSDI